MNDIPPTECAPICKNGGECVIYGGQGPDVVADVCTVGEYQLEIFCQFFSLK